MSKTVKELKSDIAILKRRLCLPHKDMRKRELEEYLKLLENSHNIGRVVPAYPTSKPPPIPKATIKIKIKKTPKKRKIKKIIKI